MENYLNFGWNVLSLQTELQWCVCAVRLNGRNEKDIIDTCFGYSCFVQLIQQVADNE